MSAALRLIATIAMCIVALAAGTLAWIAPATPSYAYDDAFATELRPAALTAGDRSELAAPVRQQQAGALVEKDGGHSQLASVSTRLDGYRLTPRTTHSLDDLSRAAGAADRNGLTAAGRAAQKHGNRPGSSFPLSPDRTASGYNQFGQNLVDDLLTAPNTATQRWVHPQFGQVTDFWGPNYGVRFGPNGEFIGFLDP